MENIYYLLAFSIVCWHFLYLRKVTERANLQAKKHCADTDTQLLSVARRFTRPCFNKEYGLHWLSTFDFEFSGDGESKYEGVLILRGLKLAQIIVPPYRVH